MLEEKSFSIPCPECKSANQVTVGDVKAEKAITCLGCGETIQLRDNGMSQGVVVAMKKARQMFRNMGKH